MLPRKVEDAHRAIVNEFWRRRKQEWKWSITMAAYKLNCSAAHLSNIERQKEKPSRRMVAAMAYWLTLKSNANDL